MSFFPEDPADHPDSLVLEIAGKEVGWLLNKSAFETAEEEGIDFNDLQTVDEEDVGANLDALAKLLYVGTIPFRESGRDTPSLEDLDNVITPRVAAEVGPRIMGQYQGLTDEEVEEALGKA